MIILDAATKSLEVKLAGAVATTQLPFSAGYSDVNSTTFAITGIASVDGATNSTAAVTMVAAPAASRVRKVALFTIHNVDTASATVTVQVNNNGTLRMLCKVTLAVGSSLQYTDGGGFQVINSDGRVLVNSSPIGTLAQFDATTSAQLAAVISDESGAPGPLLFGGTPNIGAATGTSLILSDFDLTKNNNGSAFVNLTNTSNGASAYAGIIINTDSPVAGAIFQNGSGRAAYGGVNSINVVNALNAPLALGTNNTINFIMTGAGNSGFGTANALSKVSINGGLHVGGDSDAGDNNALIDGTLGVSGLVTAASTGGSHTFGTAAITTPSDVSGVFGNRTSVVGKPTVSLLGGANGYGAGIDMLSLTTGSTYVAMAKIVADGTGAWDGTASNQDAKLEFYTAKDGTLTLGMAIDAAQTVTIPSTLDVVGPARLSNGYIVSTLPAGTVGQRAYVTDATAPTFLGALTGGGAVVCPVFYDGAAWKSA